MKKSLYNIVFNSMIILKGFLYSKILPVLREGPGSIFCAFTHCIPAGLCKRGGVVQVQEYKAAD